MKAYPIDTVSRPYRYKETETETQTQTEIETENRQKHKNRLRLESALVRWEPIALKRDDQLAERLEKGLWKEGFRLDPDQLETLVDLARWYQTSERQPLKPRRSWVYLKLGQIKKDVEALRAAGPNSPEWESLCQSFRQTLGGDEFLQVLQGEHLGPLLLAFYENPTWATFNVLRLHIETTSDNVTLLTEESQRRDRRFNKGNPGHRQKVRALFALQLEDMAERVEPGLKRKRLLRFVRVVFNALGINVNDAGARDRISRATGIIQHVTV